MRYPLLSTILVIAAVLTGCGNTGGYEEILWERSPTGLQYRDTRAGTGTPATYGDTVTVDYTGRLDSGMVFDTSKNEGGKPLEFTIGQGEVIAGWEQGLQGMKVGGVRELRIPPSLGYGNTQHGLIPPNSNLSFEVELLKIERWVHTASGLQYLDTVQGTGDAAKSGDAVTVDYTGTLDDGTVFDTSKQEGRTPFQFTIGQGQVIAGWEEGLQGMRVGGVRKLKIPPSLGYGDKQQGSIPPNSNLNFEVELLKIGS